jgi:Leucine-rich repeat (LRR) protein
VRAVLTLPAVQTVGLANRGLSAIPKDFGALGQITDLDLSGNELKEFPVEQLLGMTSLQNLKLSMESTTGKPVRKSHDAFVDQGCQITYVRQGNALAKVIDVRKSPNTVLFTTDLDPCLALSVIQGDKALLMHVDSFSGQGSGRRSVHDVLSLHIKPNEKDTRVMLVGANAQGSASNVRGVLSVLKTFGLERCITMASLGNNHTSAMLQVGNGQGYVGFG